MNPSYGYTKEDCSRRIRFHCRYASTVIQNCYTQCTRLNVLLYANTYQENISMLWGHGIISLRTEYERKRKRERGDRKRNQIYLSSINVAWSNKRANLQRDTKELWNTASSRSFPSGRELLTLSNSRFPLWKYFTSVEFNFSYVVCRRYIKQPLDNVRKEVLTHDYRYTKHEKRFRWKYTAMNKEDEFLFRRRILGSDNRSKRKQRWG